MAANNEQIAKEVLAAVGGRENVSNVTHCMTRLRFNLKDMALPKEDEIKKIKGVLGVVVAGGQYQVIIGQNVPKVYDALCKNAGFQVQAAINENLDDKPKEPWTPKRVGSSIMNYLAGSMTPMIPVMMIGGMMKMLLTLLGPTMLGLFAEGSDAAIIFDFLYDAFYYFLPIFVGATAANKLGINQYLGMYVGAALIAPDFVALSGVQDTIKIYGLFPAQVGSYGQTLVPVLLSVAVMAPIYKFFKKVVPDALSTIFVPFLTALVITPISFCLLAPAGNVIGGWLGSFLLAFGDVGGIVAIALIAGLWEFLVMTGMHIVLIMFMLNEMMTLGYNASISPAATCATFAAYGLALGAAFRLKDKEEKSLAFGYFVSGIIGGVTEPSLYGLGFKYKRPFITLFLGGALGGLYAGLTGVACYVGASASNFLMITSYIAGGTSNLVNGIISCLVAMFGTAILTFLFGFSKEDLEVKAEV